VGHVRYNVHMDSRTTISITEARRRIFAIAEEVQKPSVQYLLTEKGKPKAVIMSAEEFESWQETLEVLEQFPDIAQDMAELERDIKTGRYKKYITLDELMSKEGYAVSPRRKAKGPKRAR
jgi:antitoxin YefM